MAAQAESERPPVLDRGWIHQPCTRLVVSWMMAGGIGLVAVWETLELTRIVVRDRPVYDHLFFALLVFLVGSGLGLLHGGVLAYLARAEFDDVSCARRRLLAALVAALPAGAAAFVVASWLSLSTVALQTGPPALWLLAMLGWFLAAVVWGTAGYQALAALRLAYARWVGGAFGLAGAVLSFGLIFLVWLRYAMGTSTPLEVDVIAGSMVAFLVTVWLVVPAVTVIGLAIVGARARRGQMV